jgi:hypothetical protein
MDNNKTNHNMNHSYLKPQTVGYIVVHYCLRFVIAVVHVVVVGYIVVHYCLRVVIAVVHVVVSYIVDNNQPQHEPLLSQTSNSNGQQ